jgi:hypothetical protein
VSYESQGEARWIYNASGKSLSGFRLDAITTFPNAEFASGILPTETMPTGNGTQFSWIFTDNVAVKNPFGVFSTIDAIRNVGVLPRLLVLAPGVFLWWLMLLYFSIALSLRNVAIAGAIFFSCLLALTYFSRLIDASIIWSLISVILLPLMWSLGTNRRVALAAVICTIAGMILPVFGLLVSSSGIVLSVAGLLSVIWLVVRSKWGVVGSS